MTRSKTVLATAVAVLALVAAGCGSSSSSSPAKVSGGSSSAAAQAPPIKEVSPAGDIPDNQAYVAYAPPGAGFSAKVPEGWARSTAGGATIFTDKLNSVRMESAKATQPLTVASVKTMDIPRLAKTVPGFKAGTVSTVSRAAGQAVKLNYEATSAADPVTGKRHRNAVERYVFGKGTTRATLTLTGPVGADNVDPWKIVTDSLRFTR